MSGGLVEKIIRIFLAKAKFFIKLCKKKGRTITFLYSRDLYIQKVRKFKKEVNKNDFKN